MSWKQSFTEPELRRCTYSMLLYGVVSIIVGPKLLGQSTVSIERQTRPVQTSERANSDSHNANPLDAARIKADEIRLMAILAEHPDDPGALAGMGWVRSRQHNFPAAISYLEHAKRQRPSDTRLIYALDSARYQLMIEQGDECLKAGDLPTAQNRYRAALHIRPNASQAVNGLRAATKPTRATEETIYRSRRGLASSSP